MASTKTEVGKLFHVINHKLKNQMRKSFEEMGITMPQGMVIGLLHQKGELKISELSKQLGLSNSTISGIIDRLEKQSYVERKRSEVDRRIVHVKLSNENAELQQNFHKRAEDNFEKLLGKGTPEEIEKIAEGLKVLSKILGENED